MAMIGTTLGKSRSCGRKSNLRNISPFHLWIGKSAHDTSACLYNLLVKLAVLLLLWKKAHRNKGRGDLLDPQPS